MDNIVVPCFLTHSVQLTLERNVVPRTLLNPNICAHIVNTHNIEPADYRAAPGEATEKALSPIRRHVRGMTRLPHDKARGADRAGISGISVYIMCP